MITIVVDNQAVSAMLARARQRSSNMQPLMENIAHFVRRSVVKNFDAGGRPVPWLPSKRGALHGGMATLTDTGRLKGSMNVSANNTTAVVGTNVKYAPFHQFGTRPYLIRPKNKKALFWPGAGHPLKVVHHPGLKARPFMMVQDSDWPIIEQMVGAFITS